MNPPSNSEEFDRAYRAPITFWGDVRIPAEVKALAQGRAGQSALELGCGVGRFSHYLSQQGMRVTGVDFSPVAIAKAQQRAAHSGVTAQFLVADVTHLEALSPAFDVGFDVGCFHCLPPHAQRSYASEMLRLLAPGATHVIWAMDGAPSGERLSPASVEAVFAPHFKRVDARSSRLRFARSHWYGLRAPRV